MCPIPVLCRYNSGLVGFTDAVNTCETEGCVQEKLAYTPSANENTDASSGGQNTYKLSDAAIKAIIGQPNQGDTSAFDIMWTQTGYNSAYSNGNYEYVIIYDYTAEWTYAQVVPESSTTTTLKSFRQSDHALAVTTRFSCGYSSGNGVSCYGNAINPNPAGGSGCNINMGTSSNGGWYHLTTGWSDGNTLAYVCNGAQHSSGYRMSHNIWFRPARSSNPL